MAPSITHNSDQKPGHGFIQGHSLIELAKIHKTPLYVYDGNQILTNFSAFEQAVSLLDSKVHFAVKANSSMAILSLLSKVGAGADVVSGGELERAIKANIPAQDIIFSGVGKTEDELLLAMRYNIGQINIESGPELAIERIPGTLCFRSG